MPYIKQEDREDIEVSSCRSALNAGELNFIFSDFISDYISCHGESYQTYNDCIGALEACKLELYRRLVAKYEDEAIERNGDVY